MSREDYLNDIHVTGFINWLRVVIVTEEAFTQSFNPMNGHANTQVTLTSFRNAACSYDYDGQDLSAAQETLDELAESIQAAMQAGDADLDCAQQQNLLIACLQTLVWGGVTVKATIEWLANRAHAGALKDSIRIGSSALVADSRDALEPFRDTSLLRSDSAATKLYALANKRSIIYDNRVGAALAKLVCEYLDHEDIQELPETLAFMVKKGEARRDPSEAPDRQFKSKVTGYSHAIWNQRANWIINTLVEYGDLNEAMNVFEAVSPIRTIEAALFVMGDDISNLKVNPVTNVVTDQLIDVIDIPLIPQHIGGRHVQHLCVPTSHDFSAVINHFHQFRTQNPGSDDLLAIAEFIRDSMAVLFSTAQSYCYPLKPQQFNLARADDELVRCLAEEPLSEESFRWLSDSWQVGHTQKIMVCTWCVGILSMQGCTIPADQKIFLIDRGLAGNAGGANVMIQVGKRFGEYFDLLTPGGMPTERFTTLFGPLDF